MTSKTKLINTLNEGQRYWATWFAERGTGNVNLSIRGYETGGVDSFFPKSFALNKDL